MEVTLKCPTEECGLLFTANVNVKIPGNTGGFSSTQSLKVTVKSKPTDKDIEDILFVKHVRADEIIGSVESKDENLLTLSLPKLMNSKVVDIFTLECPNGHFNDYPIEVES